MCGDGGSLLVGHMMVMGLSPGLAVISLSLFIHSLTTLMGLLRGGMDLSLLAPGSILLALIPSYSYLYHSAHLQFRGWVLEPKTERAS